VSARVEPEWALVTILFADIRGFTTFAERSTAHETVDYLNAFFGVAVPVVEARGGTVFQLLGDGLLAVFGAPVHLPDHADSAVAAGAEMLDAVGTQFGDGCRIGIGVNSGLVVVGHVGGGRHHPLSVIGDPVNVASRVQDATRDLHEAMLLTEATRCLLETQADAVEPVASIPLKGKSQDVLVHRLKGRPLP
jgi:class 3 adenylate cyclase